MKRRFTLLLIIVSLIVAGCSDNKEQKGLLAQDMVSEAFKLFTNVIFDPANEGKIIMAKSCGGMDCLDITISDSIQGKLPMLKTRGEPSDDGYSYWGEVTDISSAVKLFEEIKKQYKDKCVEFMVVDSTNGKKVYYKECD